MKVLVVLTYYHPHWTGLTQHARLICEGLAKRGWEVEVATTKYREKLPGYETVNGVEVHRFPVTGKFSRSAFSLPLLSNIRKLISRNDVVIVYLPYAEITWVALLTKLERKKLILVHNGDLILPTGIVNRLIEGVYDLVTMFALIISDRVIVYSDDYASRSRITKKFIGKCTAILPPVESLTTKKEAIRQLRAKIPKKARKLVGFAGRFVEEKGFDILFKAIPKIVSRIPDCYFMFAGETNVSYENFYKKNHSLIEHNKDRIIWQGLLSREDVGSFYSLCNVFVISSRSECFGLTQAEAMKLRIPVVASDIPGGRVPVVLTGFGVLFCNEDADDLAEKVIDVLNNPQKYAKFQMLPKKVFDLNKSINKTSELIGEIVGQRDRSCI
jgi:glycosyltransferase involved in cell wall biosynthesis